MTTTFDDVRDDLIDELIEVILEEIDDDDNFKDFTIEIVRNSLLQFEPTEEDWQTMYSEATKRIRNRK